MPAYSIKCCVKNCNVPDVHHHRFPHPEKNFVRFQEWINILDIDELRCMVPMQVYINRRLCSAHFAPQFKSANNPRLHWNAIPSPLCFVTERGRLFSLPRNNGLRLNWLSNLNRLDLQHLTHTQLRSKGYRCCKLHFEDKQFQSNLKLKLNRGVIPKQVEGDASVTATNTVDDAKEAVPSSSGFGGVPSGPSCSQSALKESEDSGQVISPQPLSGAQNIDSISDSQPEPTHKRKLFCIHEKCITNTVHANESRFFPLPRNDNLRFQWLSKLNRLDLIALSHGQLYDRSYRVCKLHFSSKQFQNYREMKLNFGQVPLDVLAEDTESATVNVEQETISSTSDDNTEKGVKRSATNVEQEIPFKQAKLSNELNSSGTQNILVQTNQEPQITTYIEIQEDPIDDEIKIDETIRRLELLRRSRGVTLNKKMSEELGDLLKKAVTLDLKKDYYESIIYYQKGVELLCRTLKNETCEPKKIYLKNKIQEYLGRAEKIKSLLKEQETYHEQIKIENNSTGYSYEKIFRKCLGPNVESVTIEDPYIRMFHQCQNLLMFCELVVKSCAHLKKIFLVTSQSLILSETIEQQKWMNELKTSLLSHEIVLDITYSCTLHDRQISFSNGWIVKIGRGLDYFKKPLGRFSLGSLDYDLRQCNETTIDIFHQKNLKQSFG